LAYAGNRSDDIAERFRDPATQLSVRADMKLMDGFNEQIDAIERTMVTTAKIDDPVTLGFLRTIPKQTRSRRLRHARTTKRSALLLLGYIPTVRHSIYPWAQVLAKSRPSELCVSSATWGASK
jgi:hypothetical protein